MTLLPFEPPQHSIEAIDAAVERHLANERKRKVTTVLVGLAAIWYILLLAKPVMAESTSVQLAFVGAAFVLIPLWLWRKPARRIQKALEVRLPVADIYEVLTEEFELAQGEHKFDLLITRDPDFISCRFHRLFTPTCRGEMIINLAENQEFTLMKWSLRFDNRMDSEGASVVEHRLRDWFDSALYGWLD